MEKQRGFKVKAVYFDSNISEKKAKEIFCFPENIMMENAGMALEKAVMQKNPNSVLILCGSGNNGGDGYCLARRIYARVKNVFVIAFGSPKTSESILQRKMAESVGVKVFEDDFSLWQNSKEYFISNVIVDCIYGTGFHGLLPKNVLNAIEWCNEQGEKNSFCISCDIPSGINKNGIIQTLKLGKKIAFRAKKTVTMGALKTALFSDEAKDYAGKIVTSSLGITPSVFESCEKPNACLIEKKDTKTPLRKKQSVHKGDFGHACIVSGEKTGASIIAGTAALRFGAGLVTLLQKDFIENNFLTSPELMTSDDFPEKTTAVLLGSGLGRSKKSEELVKTTLDFVYKMKNPTVVLDADFFYCKNVKIILNKLNSLKNARVILTPHPKELCVLLNSCNENEPILQKDIIENRFEYGFAFSKMFPNITLIAKGANTYIFNNNEAFICNKGTNALAKAGSGDVLAGMCVSLLAQGYSALDAAITAVYFHSKAGAKFKKNFKCSPLLLIDKL